MLLVTALALAPLHPAFVPAAQLDCGDREAIPPNILRAAGPNAPYWAFGDLRLDGDLLVGSLPNEDSPSGGVRGAVYVHRRAATGGWLEPERFFASDLAVTRFTHSHRGLQVAVADGTVFLGVIARGSTGVLALEFQGGAWTVTDAFFGLAGWQYPGSTATQGYGGGFWFVAEDDRLVIGAPHVETPQSQEPGLLHTLERDASGHWSTRNVTTAARDLVNDSSWADLDGDRLACVRQQSGFSAVLFELDPTGWTEAWSSEPIESVESVALDGTRVLVGTYYGACVEVYDAAPAGSRQPFQVIASAPGATTFRGATEDYNPPYIAIVEASGGQAIVGVQDHFFGRPRVSTLEWFEGEYRRVTSTRAPAGAAAVAMSDGEVAWIGPPASFSSDKRAEPRFESWRIDDGRAVPFCPGSAVLTVTGSGVVPFDAATIIGYELPPQSLLTIFGGFSLGATPLGSGAELCIASSSLTRLGPPAAANPSGKATVATAALRFDSLGPAIVPGGTFVMQGVFRSPVPLGGEVHVTNALWTTLCR